MNGLKANGEIRSKLLFALIFILCTCFCVCLAETETHKAFLECSDDNTITLTLYRSEKEKTWYLFLPSFADLQDVTFEDNFEIRNSDAENPSALRLGANTVYIKKRRNSMTVMQSANIASMFITLDKRTVRAFKNDKSVTDTGYAAIYTENGTLDTSGTIENFHLRGNLTLITSKKGYSVKFSEKHSVLGMDKNKSWALIPNHFDNSYTRNYIAETMARQIGLKYVSDSKPLDLYINGEYRGTYVISEKVQVQSGRVDIPRLEEETEKVNDRPLSSYHRMGTKTRTKGQGVYYDIPNDPEDITGGYLLELELDKRFDATDSQYITKRGQIVRIVYPEYVSEKQFGYISSLIQSAENAVFSEDGIDPDTGKTLEEMIDLDSAALKYILDETVSNVDAGRSSCYIVKLPDDEDTRFVFCAPWDYDLSLGNRYEEGYKQFFDPKKLAVATDSANRDSIYKGLYSHESFVQRVREFFPACGIIEAADQLLNGGNDDFQTIDQWVDMLRPSLQMNYKVYSHYFLINENYRLGNDLDVHVESVKNFLQKRIAFLEREWGTER